MWLVTGICAVLIQFTDFRQVQGWPRSSNCLCVIGLILEGTACVMPCLVWNSAGERFISLASILAAIALPISFAVFAYPVIISCWYSVGSICYLASRPNIRA